MTEPLSESESSALLADLQDRVEMYLRVEPLVLDFPHLGRHAEPSVTIRIDDDLSYDLRVGVHHVLQENAAFGVGFDWFEDLDDVPVPLLTIWRGGTLGDGSGYTHVANCPIVQCLRYEVAGSMPTRLFPGALIDRALDNLRVMIAFAMTGAQPSAMIDAIVHPELCTRFFLVEDEGYWGINTRSAAWFRSIIGPD